jgi:glycosyltransferase involved in cell wall biosynthesis
MGRPFFSVIIPVFNRRHTIGNSLKTLDSQCFRDFEVVLIDDGSTDGSPEYIKEAYPDYHLIEQDNRGPGMARNAGLKLARGRYIAFLDSDDLWFPWTLKSYHTLIQEQGEPSVLLGRLCGFLNESELEGLVENKNQIRTFNDYFASSSETILAGCCNMVVRSDHLKAVGGFDGGRINAEDSELLLRLGTFAGVVVMDAPVTVGYRRHSSSETQSYPGLQRTADGVNLMRERERQSRYPGGAVRKQERRELICRHVRSTAIACRKARLWRDAFRLYRKTFFWQWALGRGRFLIGFWIIF